METKVIEGLTLEALWAGLRGAVYAPGDEGYDGASRAWNLNARQRPAVVVVAEGAGDLLTAVRFAYHEGLGVGVMATGHGVAAPCDGGVLINTSRMRGVSVDPEARTARVEAGALWSDVLPQAQTHGLAGLVGSSSGVGVVGYTLGGGFGWLGRKYGFAADSVREAEVVTADGELVKASARENADLFWGLKGGARNFGVVTSLEFALYPVPTVYGGNLFYPDKRAAEVLELYGGWSETLPDEMTTAVAFLNLPPIPQLPEPLRDGSFVSVRACYCGEEPEERCEELMGFWHEALGDPVMDTFGAMLSAAIDAISMDPTEPMGAYGHSEMLRELSLEAIETLVEVTGPSSPLILRQNSGPSMPGIIQSLMTTSTSGVLWKSSHAFSPSSATRHSWPNFSTERRGIMRDMTSSSAIRTLNHGSLPLRLPAPDGRGRTRPPTARVAQGHARDPRRIRHPEAPRIG